MNLILIIRSDILSTMIVFFLIVYDIYCARYRTEKNPFLPFALCCFGHDVMALITEITVNTESVPVIVNNIAHILFFAFSVLYSLKYFEYALSLIMTRRRSRKYIIAAYVLCLIALGMLLVSPIDYLEGFGTKYSAGIGPTLCYVMGFLLFITADVIMLVNHKRIASSIIYALLPISTMALGFLVVQILVPEFLFTGGALTLMVLGMFCSTENPVGKLQQLAFVDPDTQVWNRRCYENDLEKAFPAKVKGGADLTYVLGDVNGLKKVNDVLGHQTGDQLLKDVSNALLQSMYHSYRIYRIGGDEFAIVYVDTEDSVIESEVAQAREKADSLNYGESTPVGISFGVARRAEGEELEEMIRRADLAMYSAKEAYYRERGIERRRS